MAPEDVGFGSPGTIATLWLSIILSTWAQQGFLVVLILLLVGVCAIGLQYSRLETGLRKGLLLIAAGFATLPPVAMGQHLASEAPYSTSISFVVALAVAALLLWTGTVYLSRSPTSRRQLASFLLHDVSRALPWIALSVVAIPAVVGYAFILPQGSFFAALVQAGYPVDEFGSPWTVYPVSVNWLRTPVIDPVEDNCAMYLGQANGFVVLYDVRHQHAVKVPTSEVSLSRDRNRIDSCAPPSAKQRLLQQLGGHSSR